MEILIMLAGIAFTCLLAFLLFLIAYGMVKVLLRITAEE